MNLTFESISPYFIIMAAVLMMGWILSKTLPFYKKNLKADEHGRYEMLDGLRGILAIAVLFQHAVTNHFYFLNGFWQMTEVKFYRFLGGEAVIIFFMITSFLYWSKAIARKGNMNTLNLYMNRVLRLAPMYLFSAGIVVLLALIATRFNFSEPVLLIRDVLSWFTLGIETTTSVNGISIIPFNAGIHWTLHFEWIFYLVLPIAALILTKTPLRFIAVPIFAYVLLSPYRGYWMIFFFGIAAAHIVHKYPAMPWLKGKLAGLLPVLGLIVLYFMGPKPYSPEQYIVSLLVLLCFIYGNSLFGLLRTASTKFLGMISYSIYLLHGIVLHLVLTAVNYFHPINTLSPLVYWGYILLAALMTVLVSAFTYQYIEYPFIERIARAKRTTSLEGEVEKTM
jgi:peptidoglycan/LPS O-acetylase OafA/YrhL